MGRIASFGLGAILGGVLGSSLVLLLTPSSGENVRQQVRSYAENVEQEVRQAAAARRSELEKQLEALRLPRPANPS